MNIHVICNPKSGNGEGKNVLQKTVAYFRDHEIAAAYHETQGPKHAIELAAQAVKDGAETVIAIGGDGTLHEVIQSVAGTNTALGILPAGTGNDFVKTIHVPVDTEQAVRLILEGTPKPVDTVRINDRLFLNECGCGFDVMVLDYAEKAKKMVKGILPYLYGVLQTIFHFKDIHVSLSVDDEEPRERDILVLAVGNGRFIGGGIPIAPSAIPDDGLLNVLVVHGMTKPRMLSVLPGLLKGKIESFPETTHQLARKVSLKALGIRVNIDGEIITMDHADIEVVPSSLLIYRP